MNNSQQAKCILLVRASNDERAQKRVDELLRYLYPEDELFQQMSERVSFVIGDVSQEQLGMSADDWESVSNASTYILHAAALTDWGASYEDSSAININGVKEVIKLAHACGDKLNKMLHISSAYVTGSRSGNLTADDFGSEEEACDNYQRTKKQGELLIREAWETLPITVVRPGAVVGNAANGRTLTYKTFYYPLQILYNGLPLVLPVNKKGNLEAVPSDWSAKIMYEMMMDSSTNGKSYHLTSGNRCLTNLDIRQVVYKVFNELGEKPKNTVYIPYFLYKHAISHVVKKKIPSGDVLDNQIRLYRHYMTYVRNFDNADTLAFSQDKNINLPEFESYLPRLMNYAISDKWARKRKIMNKMKNRAKARA